jgi:hypothetical protein
MSVCTIWTDLSHEEQEKRKDDFLATASAGDIIIYQGPNQMDQTRYEVVIKDGKKELKWTHSPYDYYDCY